MWEGAHGDADGIRVPVAVEDFLILKALRESGGTAISIDDEDMIKYTKVMGPTT
jgi:threonine synthase